MGTLQNFTSFIRGVGEAATKAKPFYSAVDEAIASLPNKALGDQFVKELLKRGVKPQEIIDRRIGEKLGAPILQKTRTVKLKKPDEKGRTEIQEKYFEVQPSEKGVKSVSRKEVERIAAENPAPQIREKVLRGERPEDEHYSLEFDDAEEAWVVSDQWGMPKRRFDDEEEALEYLNAKNLGTTHYERDGLTFPGGENYREILIKLPSGYQSKHFDGDGKDLLAHARISDRTGPNGEKILHVEEVQSDLHQQGRKHGYQTEDMSSRLGKLREKHASESSLPERMKLMEQIQDLEMTQSLGVPDTPFQRNWHELVLKRLLDDAVRGGYDRVVITPGAEQMKRYPDASKTPEELLRGFAGFYDEKLPAYLNRYGSKWKASVRPNSYPLEGVETPLHSFDITPQMREEITVKGQPLYQVAPPAIGAGALMGEEDQGMKRGGTVKKRKNGGEIKASPTYLGQESIGRIGQVAEKLGISLQEAMKILSNEGNSPIRAFIADKVIAAPLRSAGTALQDWTGTPRDITPDAPYSRLLSGKGMTTRLDPRVLDVAQFAVPPALRAKAVAKGLPDAIKDAAVAAYGPGATASYVIKPKGGNWLQGSVENAMRGLKRLRAEDLTPLNEVEVAERIARGETGQVKPDPINQFIDKQLTRYVKNEMGTAEDPVRALAEKGTIHTNIPIQPGGAWVEGRVPAGESDQAKNWDALVDQIPRQAPYREHISFLDYEQNKTDNLRRLGGEFAVNNEEALAYDFNRGKSTRDLGFDHLIDELRNATNPESGLPRNLLLKPESLSRLSVPQAVERVAKINEWRASQKAEADLARARNPATVLHKEYPEGYSWQELKLPEKAPEGWTEDVKPGAKANLDPNYAYGNPALEDALKYEGEQMGHCVGGYCPDVASGKSRIFSLRDAKGQPHVTIETRPKDLATAFGNLPDEERFAIAKKVKDEYFGGAMPGVSSESKYYDLLDQEYIKKYGNAPESIKQIKGKSNRAPNEEYLPYVQDFVRSGKWSEIGDSQNAGLRRYGDVFNVNEQRGIEATGEAVPENDWLTGEDIQRLHNAITPEGKRLKYDARGNIIGGEAESGMKRGGAVKKSRNVSQDAMNIAVLNKRLKGK